MEKITFVEAGSENDKGVVGRIDFPKAMAIVTHNPLESTHEEIVAVVNKLIKRANCHDELLDACKAIKLRIAFIGHPNEPKNENGPDWSKEIGLLEQAIAAAEKD